MKDIISGLAFIIFFGFISSFLILFSYIHTEAMNINYAWDKGFSYEKNIYFYEMMLIGFIIGVIFGAIINCYGIFNEPAKKTKYIQMEPIMSKSHIYHWNTTPCQYNEKAYTHV